MPAGELRPHTQTQNDKIRTRNRNQQDIIKISKKGKRKQDQREDIRNYSKGYRPQEGYSKERSDRKQKARIKE